MEQLFRDKNYTGFLIRTIADGIKNNKFKAKEEVINFVNKINIDLPTDVNVSTNVDFNSSELCKYVKANGFNFNKQEFNNNINRVLQEFDNKLMQSQNIAVQPVQSVVTPTSTMQNMQNPQINNMQNLPVQNVPAQPVQNVVNQQPSFVQPSNQSMSAAQPTNVAQDQYIPITKIDVNNTPKDIIDKANFIIVNPNFNPNDYMVDLVSGNFKNINDNKIYVVNKNMTNGNFELVAKTVNNVAPMPKVESSNNVQNNNILNDTSMFSDDDLKNMLKNPNISEPNRIAFTNELNNRMKNANLVGTEQLNQPKKLVKVPDLKNINNAAFASTVLLTTLSAISGIVIATILLTR